MEFTTVQKRAVEMAWADVTSTTDFGPLPDSMLESWLRQYPAVVVIASIGAASHATREFNDEKHLRNYCFKTMLRMATNYRDLQAADSYLRRAQEEAATIPTGAPQ